jgi:hypothetical protein
MFGDVAAYYVKSLVVCVMCTVQSETATLHSAQYTYYQGLDIICSHIFEQSTTTYFKRLF